jgi:putative chitinase
MTALKSPRAFFDHLRGGNLLGPQLSPDEVNGCSAILAAVGGQNWSLAWAAYGLGTAYHETAHTMLPVREAYWLDEGWRETHLRYYPWYGRGFVQLTWRGDDKQPEYGYARADKELGLDGKLMSNPDLAMQPGVAADILARGMGEGWFSGKSCADYLPRDHPAELHDFIAARRIINGTDRAALVAGYAVEFQKALALGGWE